MPDWLFAAEVFEGPLLYGVYAAGAVVFLYLLGKSASARWIAAAIIALVVGAGVGFSLTFVMVDLLNVFAEPLRDVARWWVMAAFAGIALAVANLWTSRWWRKLIAVLAIPLFAGVAVLGINTEYRAAETVGGLVDATRIVILLVL